MKWCYGSSHLLDNSNWATNTSLFRNFYEYRPLYMYMQTVRWWWLHGGLFQRWCLAAPPECSPQTPVLLGLLLDCQELWISPSVCAHQEPKALWGLLSFESGTSSQIRQHIFVRVIFTLMWWGKFHKQDFAVQAGFYPLLCGVSACHQP